MALLDQEPLSRRAQADAAPVRAIIAGPVEKEDPCRTSDQLLLT